MRTLVEFLTSPLSVFWLLIAISGIFYWFKKKQPAKIAGISALALLFITASDPLPDWLIRRLEDKYPPLLTLPFTPADTAVNVLVLGGGNVPDPALTAIDQLSSFSLGRLTEGIRIHRLLPGSRLITSGFSRNGQKTQAAITADAAISLGVDTSAITMIEEPTNTWEEAVAYKKKFGTTGKLILVTSAFHMPRAMQLFKAQGLNPVPAPAGHIYKTAPDGENPIEWFSVEENISKIEIALHEYIGMVWGKG
jgi:uncharacterized SAM-binding protein YcdF (DUF218 family)